MIFSFVDDVDADAVRETPFKFMVWGTFLEKNFSSSNGHLLDFGGV